MDELRFGESRTLNLRDSLPVPLEAVTRTEAWLRERQVAGAGEVLIITGRGRSSPGGISPVREAVERHFGLLRRRGVIESVQEHTPGSFVVQLAPVSNLFAAPRSRRHPAPPPVPVPDGLAGLERETLQRLHALAERTLDSLGVRTPTAAQLENAMERKFTLLAAALPDGPGRESRLRQAIDAAIRDLEDQ